MAFIAILMVIVANYWLNLSGSNLSKQWLEHLLLALANVTQAPEAGDGWSGALQLLLVPVLGFGLLCWLLFALFGWFASFVVAVIWLWYCIDAHSYQQQADSEQVFVKAYRGLFAKLFWFVLFGPVGLAVYVVTELLLAQYQDTTVTVIQAKLSTVQAILDWVPVRLFGLSFALVGVFSATMTKLRADCCISLSNADDLVIAYGQAACSDTDSANLNALVARCLWVWLVTMALISIGMLM